MRIMLFPKLIKDEESRAHCLKDCSVVIDGNNFFYHTYEHSKLPFVFGSEANQHAKYLRKILHNFRNANVKCYFVFKGGSESMTKKLQRTEPMVFDFESNYRYVSPVFLKEVCKQVLQEAGVNYATSFMESKDDCVALAQRLGCSVLSNDIEYCFKNAPYIPMTTLKYTRNAIQCRQYNISYFLTKHRLSHKKLAIFAALCNTDVFPQNYFNILFEIWGICDKNLFLQNKKLLHWLSEHSEDEIIKSAAVIFTNKNEHEKFLNEINNVLASMQNDHESIVSEYLEKGCKLNVNRADPLWFEKGVVTQNIAIPYINLCKHKLIQGSTAIEKQSTVDSIIMSIDIIKYAYNLLTNFQAKDFSIYNYSEREKMTSYVKIKADDLNIEKPSCIGTAPVFQNGWSEIKHLKLFEHFLTENDINTDIINKVPSEATMLVIALTYFARKKAAEGVDVTKLVFCFIVCHVILRVVSDKKGSWRKKSSGISENDSAEALQATDKYFKFNKEQAKLIYDEEELKAIVQAQMCLAHMNYLNTLCGATYKPTVYHRSYNGTFVYQLYHAMCDHNEDHFLHNLFRHAPSVYSFTNKLLDTYKQLV